MVKTPLQHAIQDDRVIAAPFGLQQRALHIRLIFPAGEDMTVGGQGDALLFAAGRIEIADGEHHGDALAQAAQRPGIHPGIISAFQQRHLSAERRDEHDQRHMSDSTACRISFLKT